MHRGAHPARHAPRPARRRLQASLGERRSRRRPASQRAPAESQAARGPVAAACRLHPPVLQLEKHVRDNDQVPERGVHSQQVQQISV